MLSRCWYDSPTTRGQAPASLPAPALGQRGRCKKAWGVRRPQVSRTNRAWTFPLPPLSAPRGRGVGLSAGPGWGRPVSDLGSRAHWGVPAAFLRLARPQRGPHRTFRPPCRAGPKSSALCPSPSPLTATDAPAWRRPAQPGLGTASSVFVAVSWVGRIRLARLDEGRALRSRRERPGPSAAPWRPKAVVPGRPPSPPSVSPLVTLSLPLEKWIQT